MDGDLSLEEAHNPREELCSTCKGTGWVSRQVPVGHPDFGELFPCRCQESPSENKAFSRLLRYSNLGPLSRVTFDTAEPDGIRSDAESKRLFRSALEAARKFSEDPTGWLVFTGASATGKTHLAAAVANRCIEQGQAVFFAVVPDLLDQLKGTFTFDSSVSYEELLHQVRNVPVLVLDDLGSQSNTPWAQEKLFQILNHRFNYRLPTVVTIRGSLNRIDSSIRTRIQAEGLSSIHHLGQAQTELLRVIGSLTKRMLGQMKFENFKAERAGGKLTNGVEPLKDVLKMAKSFAESPEGWLVFAGPHGCGKTHLAVAIINERLKKGEPVLFAEVPALLDHLRASTRPDSYTAENEISEEDIKSAPLLILDDLGSEYSTTWGEEKLYQIVAHRHNLRLPTVINAGYVSLNDLDKAKPRIASRLIDSDLVEWAPIWGVDDYRDLHPNN